MAASSASPKVIRDNVDGILLAVTVQSFMLTRSRRFGDCFYWRLQPEYTTCLGWRAAVVLPSSPTENRNQASLKPIERVNARPRSIVGTRSAVQCANNKTRRTMTLTNRATLQECGRRASITFITRCINLSVVIAAVVLLGRSRTGETDERQPLRFDS